MTAIKVQPRRRRNSLRRTPEISDLRGGDDSGISLNTNANRSLSLQDSDDFGLSGLDLDVGRGLTIDSGGRTFLGSNGGLNGHRARRSAFSGTGTTPVRSEGIWHTQQRIVAPINADTFLSRIPHIYSSKVCHNSI